MSVLADPLLQLVLASALAVLFGLAAAHKWAGRRRFAATLEAYGVLRSWTPVLGTALAGIETLLCVGLLIVDMRRTAAVLAIATLLVYAFVLARVVVDGREIADCGCSMGAPQAVHPALVARNVLLALAAGLLLLPPAGRALGGVDLLIGGAALTALIVLYAGVNALLANQPTTRELAMDRGPSHG